MWKSAAIREQDRTKRSELKKPVDVTLSSGEEVVKGEERWRRKMEKNITPDPCLISL